MKCAVRGCPQEATERNGHLSEGLCVGHRVEWEYSGEHRTVMFQYSEFCRRKEAEMRHEKEAAKAAAEPK